ncbi:hypothetical protein AB0M36_08885 [Actinoplanes sp. NPDC051346]|uniref:hypothetical protein n=1 Tax=Actinoplanes sp. NPDC051346 TaxID=3155048 RepID=UPI003444571C
MRRATTFVGAILAIAVIAGCTSTPQHLEGAAAPAGSASSASPAASASPTPVSTPSRPAVPSKTPVKTKPITPTNADQPASAKLVLGPTGLGALKLRMTAKQAQATGMIRLFAKPSDGGCGSSLLKGSTSDPSNQIDVYHSANFGVVMIAAYGKIRTPEGIGLGSSEAEVKRTYPDWKDSLHGEAAAPRNSQAYYIILMDDKGFVSSLSIADKNQDCFN